MTVSYGREALYSTGMYTTYMPSWEGWQEPPGTVSLTVEEQVMRKFFRQIFKDPVEHDLVEEYFGFDNASLLLALFHRGEMIKTIKCIKSEKLRKEDIDYENKVQMMDDSQKAGESIETVTE